MLSSNLDLHHIFIITLPLFFRKCRRLRSHILPVFLVFTAMSLSPLFVHGAVFDDTDDAPPASIFFAVLEVGFIVDDNIFQEKEAKTSDVILESSLFLVYEMNEVFVSVLAISDRYTDNDALDYSFYQVGIEGPLGTRNTGSLFLNLSPAALLDKADAGPPFELASRGLNLLLDHEMSWGSIGFFFSVTQLTYSVPFEAKNSDVVSLGPSFFYFLRESWVISGDAAFERGRATGGLILDRRTDSVSRDDISYRATVLSLQTRYHFSPRVNARLKYRLRRKNFTTDLNDPIHAGRWDNSHFLRIEAEVRPFSNITLRAGFEETRVFSSKPEVEFEARRWIFSVAYSF